MLAEAKLLPLEIRRNQLLLNYLCKIASYPDHKNYEILQNFTDITYKHSFKFRIKELLNSLQTEIPKIYPKTIFTTISPWRRVQHTKPIIDLDILDQQKKYKPQTDYLLNLFDFKRSHTYKGFKFIYTDASVNNDRVGCAALTLNDFIITRRLPDKVSIKTAESFAILLALDVIEERGYESCIICCDSMETLTGLKNDKMSNHNTDKIIDRLSKINFTAPSTKIIFLWIPSHIGIEGNEEADKAAKNAARDLNYENEIIWDVDLRNYWGNLIKNKWEIKWKELVNSKYSRHTESFFKKNIAFKLARRDQVIISRVKIAHTNISHIYLMIKEDPPMCNNCNINLSIDHLIIDCNIYDDYRRRNEIDATCMKNLNTQQTTAKIIKFLKDTKKRL